MFIGGVYCIVVWIDDEYDFVVGVLLFDLEWVKVLVVEFGIEFDCSYGFFDEMVKVEVN